MNNSIDLPELIARIRADKTPAWNVADYPKVKTGIMAILYGLSKGDNKLVDTAISLLDSVIIRQVRND